MRIELELEQNTPEWLESREKYVTGSNAIILLTKGVAEAIAKNKGSSLTGNFWTTRGHILEGQAIALYAGIYSIEVYRAGVVRDSRFKNAQCSPDGEDMTNDKLIEVKSFKRENHLKEIEKPSARYIAQANFNALICGRKRAVLVYFCPDNKLSLNQQFVEIDVTNKAIQANIKRKLKEN